MFFHLIFLVGELWLLLALSPEFVAWGGQQAFAPLDRVQITID